MAIIAVDAGETLSELASGGCVASTAPMTNIMAAIQAAP